MRRGAGVAATVVPGPGGELRTQHTLGNHPSERRRFLSPASFLLGLCNCDLRLKPRWFLCHHFHTIQLLSEELFLAFLYNVVTVLTAIVTHLANAAPSFTTSDSTYRQEQAFSFLQEKAQS